jgi:hypothetical protein
MRAYRDRVASSVQVVILRGLLVVGLLGCSAVHERTAAEDDVPPASSGEGTRVAGASAGAAGTGGSSGSAGDSSRVDAGATSGATTGMAGRAGTAGTGEPAPPNVPDDRTIALGIACGLLESVTLFASCMPEAQVGQSACSLNDEPSPCSYFIFADDDPNGAGVPILACQSHCVAIEGDGFWSNSCVECGRDECVPPTPSSVVHELDVSDCEDRPLTPCVADHATKQRSLDATLAALLPRESDAFSDLHNVFLQVVVEDGCPSRFYVPGIGNPLERVSAVLGPALSDKRFECAVDLSCGLIQGPDTLATP